MHNLDKKPTYFAVRFADGTKMWLNTDSPTDVLLDPAFLKFMAISIILAAMLDGSGADREIIRQEDMVLLWIFHGIITMLWFASVFAFINFLAVRGLIASVFSPFVVMPQIILAQLTVYFLVNTLSPENAPSLGYYAWEILRGVVTLLAYDVMFSSFVVHRHSAFSSVPVELYKKPPPPATAVWNESLPVAVDADPTVTVAPEDIVSLDQVRTLPAMPANPAALETELPSPTPEIRLGRKMFNIGEIELIRAEDHYLAIYTSKTKELVRAKMEDTVAKLGVQYGVQVSRSTWVAFSVVNKVIKTGRTYEVLLKDGNTIDVAAPRGHAVYAAVAARGLEVD